MVARKIKGIDLHVKGDCDCFDGRVLPIDKSCIYQTFPDGMDFTADTGKGQVRGEVFTPLFIINKMITDNGLLPSDGVYNFDYSLKNLSGKDKEREYERIIKSRVIEPAVGSGNYITTVLWHKINYSYAYYCYLKNKRNSLEVSVFYKFLLESLASLYCFDVDCGNVLVTRSRIMGVTGALNSEFNIGEYCNEIKGSLDLKTIEENKGVLDDAIEGAVLSSLNEAQYHWGDKLLEAGIINKLHLQLFSREAPINIMEECERIVKSNIKIFNGIVEDDTIENNFVCAGTNNVIWNWWSVSGDLSLTFETVSLRDQLNHNKIIELEGELESFKNAHFILDGEALIPFAKWDSKANENFYKKKLKELEELR